MAFKPAERKRVFVKIGISAPSGGGKTFGALKLAKGLVTKPDGSIGKIALADTENESASLYAGVAGIPSFDTDVIRPPFLTDKYVEAIKSAETGGYEVLILDSGSHQWQGEGGILDRMDKEKLANPKLDKYTMWARYTPEHNRFISALLQSQIHIIITLRSKQEYAMEKQENGKHRIQKLGAAPVQRDQFEYELSCMFDVNEDHYARVSKDRTHLFDAEPNLRIGEDTGIKIRDWLLSGKEPDPAPQLVQQKVKARQEALQAVITLPNWPKGSVAEYMAARFGTAKVGELTDAQFVELVAAVKDRTFNEAMGAIQAQYKGSTAAIEAATASEEDPFLKEGQGIDEPGATG